MRRSLKIFTILVAIVILSFYSKALAASANLSVNKGSVYVDETFTVTVYVSSAAAWNVHVNASGPVGNCSINNANATDDAMDTNKTFQTTCTATGAGNITLSLSGDVTSASNGVAVGISGSKSITVSNKPDPTPSGGGNNNNNNKQEEKKSNDCSLSALSIEGYNLVRVDDNNYTLEVRNDISSINVTAKANNLKAKVEGAGVYELVEGENPITITVTAEDGTKNVINIVITKKEKEKEIIPIEPEKKEEPKKETKKKINITPKDYLIFGSLLLNVLLIVALVVLYLKHQKLLDSTKNMVVASSDFPFEYLSENEK
ncbi:MAG: cadherin-like beta sandwich domain-containing protein [Bacilli bacterium]|nr:cadherin-like beta sandwich domain-containing protein [Bacilli bacterium]